MTNPFDAATPAMIECFEANQRAYAQGLLKPNYQLPVPMRCAWCNSREHTAFGLDEYCPDRMYYCLAL